MFNNLKENETKFLILLVSVWSNIHFHSSFVVTLAHRLSFIKSKIEKNINLIKTKKTKKKNYHPLYLLNFPHPTTTACRSATLRSLNTRLDHFDSFVVINK